MILRRFDHALLLAVLVGCSGDAATTPQRAGDSKVRFVVSNHLAPPVDVAIDGTLTLILASGDSSGLAVSPSAQWLTWTAAKPTDSTGTPIPDDVGHVQVRITGIQSAVEITNIIDDTTFVTPMIFNETGERVSIGVYEGAAVACASTLPAATATNPGFTRVGYYRLLPNTEVRAYRDAGCTGPYVAWDASQLAAFTPKSGVVSLDLRVAP